MRWKRDGTGKRPVILITAGITAPWALLSVQQCNHQPSTCNARAAAALPEEGEGEGREGGEHVDSEQMDNVSSATVLQPMMNLRLNTADWMFCFLSNVPQSENYVFGIITLFDICSVLNTFTHFFCQIRWSLGLFFQLFPMTFLLAASLRSDSAKELMEVGRYSKSAALASCIKCMFIIIFLDRYFLYLDAPHHSCYTNNEILSTRSSLLRHLFIYFFILTCATLKGNRKYVCNSMVSHILSNDPSVIKSRSPLQEDC